jgi:hypothetical protein
VIAVIVIVVVAVILVIRFIGPFESSESTDAFSMTQYLTDIRLT